MGCCEVKDQRIDFENKVAIAEFSLGISKISLRDIKQIILRYNTNGLISSEQLRMICKHLQLNRTDKFESYVESFYKSDLGCYDMMKLNVAVAILGVDSIKNKCSSLFDIFSLNSKDQIEYSELSSMIKAIIDISFGINLDYAIKFYEMRSQEIVEGLRHYKLILERVSSEISAYFIGRIMKKSKIISLSEFFESFKSIDVNSLLESHTLRVHSLVIKNTIEENSQYKQPSIENSKRVGNLKSLSLKLVVHNDNSTEIHKTDSKIS